MDEQAALSYKSGGAICLASAGARPCDAGHCLRRKTALNRPELPDELRRFILTSVPSVPYLEAVLLLRAQPGTPWTAAAMAQRIYLPEAEVRALLETACEVGLASRQQSGSTVAFGYKPGTPELTQLMDHLAAHYAADIVTVASLIHSRTDKRAEQFAGAFRWRKDS
jgi:hypothetical protein